jgi:hypothetical protein
MRYNPDTEKREFKGKPKQWKENRKEKRDSGKIPDKA